MNQQPNTPTYAAYHVRENKSGDAGWTRIGSAWQHRDGSGLSLILEAMPIGGRVTLRTITAKAE